VRKISFLFFIIFFANYGSAYPGGMDLMMRSIVRKGEAATWSKTLPERGGIRLVPCLVKSKNAKDTIEFVEKSGGSATAITGSILSASIPIDMVKPLADREEVLFVEFSSPLSSKMDTARAAGNVADVQNGKGLGVKYKGKNVVIGVVDDGLDYGHPDFWDSSRVTRIQYLKQKIDDRTIECTKGSITGKSCEIEDGGQGFTHGTHVTGIAASSDSEYTGIAPQADIMFAFLDASDAYTSGELPTSFGASVVDSVAAIFEKADLLDKAAVVNLSLGTSLGAHDGTSLMEEGLTEQTGVGRIIVGAAGNEQVIPESFWPTRRPYIGGIHSSIAVGSKEAKGSRLAIWNGSSSTSSFVGGTMVDIWLDGNAGNCELSVYGYTEGRAVEDFTFAGLTSTSQAVLHAKNISFGEESSDTITAEDGSVKADIEIDPSDIRNDKPHATVLLYPAKSELGALLESMWFDIVIKSSSGECSGNMWLYYDHTSFHDFLKGIEGVAPDMAGSGKGAAYDLFDGDSLMTTTIPATAKGVIAVGSWLAEKPIGSGVSEWTGMNGKTYSQADIDSPGGLGSIVDDLSSFSSLGPTADARTKPDIVAPGEPIVSSKARESGVSSALKTNELHFKNAGTSMASPYIAGVVALLLERNNTLGVKEVRNALAEGASEAGMTKKTTDKRDSFGAGKINAVEVLDSVEEDTSAYKGTGDLESASGCSLTDSANLHRSAVFDLLLLILASTSLALLARIFRAAAFLRGRPSLHRRA